jgi:hypothetical protein
MTDVHIGEKDIFQAIVINGTFYHRIITATCHRYSLTIMIIPRPR